MRISSLTGLEIHWTINSVTLGMVHQMVCFVLFLFTIWLLGWNGLPEIQLCESTADLHQPVVSPNHRFWDISLSLFRHSSWYRQHPHLQGSAGNGFLPVQGTQQRALTSKRSDETPVWLQNLKEFIKVISFDLINPSAPFAKCKAQAEHTALVPLSPGLVIAVLVAL